MVDVYDQKVERLIESLGDGQNTFLSGSGGVGKTHAIRIIAKTLIQKGLVVACCATTGIAAIALSNPTANIAGCTLHSWAGIGLGDMPAEKLVAKINGDARAKKRWLSTHILIIDEVSMLGATLIDKIDYIGRSIRRRRDTPFGGITVLFSGDFLQLPPVNDKWVFKSAAWKDAKFECVILDEPKRYPDVEWFNLLMRLRKGVVTPADTKFLKGRVIAYEKMLGAKPKIKKGENEEADDKTTVVKPTVLHSRRVDVEAENNRELRLLPGELKTYIAVDTFEAFNSHARKDHYTKPLEDTIPTAISLKIGTQVMLKANLDVDNGLANGSRGVVIEMFDEGVKVKWVNGEKTLVPLYVWVQQDRDGIATRSQIPLILAWSLTIHKCQGSSLDYAICDIGASIFVEGQAYVALSRVRTSSGLFLVQFDPKAIRVDADALEIVEKMEERERRSRIVEEDAPEPIIEYYLYYEADHPDSFGEISDDD